MIAKENKLLYTISLINFASLCALFAINPKLCYLHFAKIAFSSIFILLIKNMMPTIWMQLTELSYVGIVMLLLINLLTQTTGIKRWTNLFGVFVQFSEFSKIILVLMLAKFLSDNKLNLKNIIISSLIILIPALLIIKQPNLGTGIVCLAVGAGMIFIKGIDRKFVLIAMFIIGTTSPVLWKKMLPYQKARIVSFLNPTSDPKGQSYQTIQSIIAIGSGGLIGSNATQNKLGFVPENHTDFLFSNFAEHFGFIASFILIFLMFYGIMQVIEISVMSTQPFKKMFCIGFALLWLVEVVMNIGMNIGLLPVTGIALPFFSYGGSSMLSFFIGIGIIINITKYNKAHL